SSSSPASSGGRPSRTTSWSTRARIACRNRGGVTRPTCPAAARRPSSWNREVTGPIGSTRAAAQPPRYRPPRARPGPRRSRPTAATGPCCCERTEEAVHMANTPPPKAVLRRGALRLPAVLMQGIGHTAPATAILLTLPLTVSYAGVAAPLAYLLAFVVVVMLGVGLTQLARHLPSAGGYYTYVSRTVHPRAGFLTAWLFFLYTPMAPAFSLAMMGFVLETSLRAEYDIVV